MPRPHPATPRVVHHPEAMPRAQWSLATWPRPTYSRAWPRDLLSVSQNTGTHAHRTRKNTGTHANTTQNTGTHANTGMHRKHWDGTHNTGMGNTETGLRCVSRCFRGVFVPAPGLQILRRELAMTSAPGKITNVTQVLPRATGWPPVPSIWSSRGRGSSELRVNVSGQRDVPTTQLSAPAPPERQ